MQYRNHPHPVAAVSGVFGQWLLALFVLFLLGTVSPLAAAYEADLKINKLDISDDSPDEGQTITILIEAKNNGSDITPVPGVYVDAPLPAGLTFVSASGGSYAAGVWTIGNLADGATTSLTITATVDFGTGGQTLVATATISSTDAGYVEEAGKEGDNTLSKDIVVNAADMEITKSVNQDKPIEGQTIEYTITAKNKGPGGASGVQVTDLLPAGVTFSSIALIEQGTYSVGTGLWDIGALAKDDNVKLEILVTVDAGTAAQTITNTAELTGLLQADDDATNNIASVDIFVEGADLAVTKTVDITEPEEGDTIVFTIRIDNNGPENAENITLTDVLPAGLTYVSSNESQGDPYNSGTGTWFADKIDDTKFATLTITATVDFGTRGDTIINTASITAVDQDDSITGNNSDSATIYVPAQVQLAINKTTSTPSVNAGGVASYAIVVSNSGDDVGNAVTVDDILPAGFTYAATTLITESGATRTGVSDPVIGSVTPGWGTWNISPGGSVTINFTADVAASTPAGTYDNVASASASNHETITDDGSATDEDVTVLDADVALLKSVDEGYRNEGDTVVYTLTASNNGPGYASGVVVTDTLPSSVSLVSAVPSQGSCAGDPVVICDLGTINSGGSGTITLTATVNTGLGEGALSTNAATISADQFDPNAGNNSATADFYSCPANFIPNGVAVTSSNPDPSLLDNNDAICIEILGTDFGDAPASYGDAIHYIWPDLYLGSVGPDDELESQSSADAMGDNDTGSSDEEGVVFLAPAGGGDNVIAQVSANNATGAAVTLCGWMDIDRSGIFDAGERQCTTTTAANPAVEFEWIVNGAASASYFSRFRICSVTADCNAPAGAAPASNGETEDYMISYNPTVVIIGLVGLDAMPVAEFLAEIGVERLGDEELLELLQAWSPEQAAALAGASRAEVLQALRRYLDPDGDGQVAIVRWDTLEERGTVGFFVERQSGNDGWQRINNDMLPALIFAPMGGEYMIADPTARAGNVYRYRLIEQEAAGSTRAYGPYQLEMP